MAVRGEHCILVIERDTALREHVLVPGLCAAGLHAVGVEDAAAARRCMLAQRFSLFLLDAGVAEGGVRFVQTLRELTGAGIVALMQEQASEHERRAMLEQGADTCLVKPVGIDVLVSSVHDLLRQLQSAAQSAAGWTEISGWRIETHGWDLILPDGRILQLTHGECLLLEILSASPGRAVPYEAILTRFSDAMLPSNTQRLGKMVGRLRRKIAGLTSERLPLSVVRGVGYVLNADPLAHPAALRQDMRRVSHDETAATQPE
jgi:DNA-binding response OmpR family regulator